MTPSAPLARAAAALAGVRDVLDERVAGPEVPAWCRVRGWDTFLLGLTDDQLERCEAEGLHRLGEGLGAPASLVDVAHAVTAATSGFEGARNLVPPPVLHGANPRKRAQVAALIALCEARRSDWARIVDVGAGRGHLTRELSRALGLPAVGLEHDPARVLAARALTPTSGPVFLACDALENARFLPGDLVIGLHACGRLGDALVEAVARDAVDLVLINCCLQKIGAAAQREPLSARGREAGLRVRRDVLGLTNLTIRSEGTEGTTPGTMAARTIRYGLRLLLRARGVDGAPGDEMQGLHRRQVRQGLAVLAARAFAQRGWPAPSADEVRAASDRARAEHAVMRRLALPRSMLGRMLEVAVVLDRACALEEAGQHHVSVDALFERAISPRNLAIVAWRKPHAAGAR